MPKDIVDDYTEWISNFDIEAVLNQYHEDLPHFYFYGAIPRDFHKCSVRNIRKERPLRDGRESRIVLAFC